MIYQNKVEGGALLTYSGFSCQVLSSPAFEHVPNIVSLLENIASCAAAVKLAEFGSTFQSVAQFLAASKLGTQ